MKIMDEEKICFVVMGYGVKPDFATGRKLNLDMTYENVIKPVFEELGIKCFRASDVKHSGTIDEPMYRYIQKADIVVADISTLNPNAIYELGVRHALRPQTTIVIAEQEMVYPFDLSHTSIMKYEHMGTDIGYTEVIRFRKALREMVEGINANPRNDSPVYTHLPELQPPSFTAKEIKELEVASNEADTVSSLLKTAAKAISETNFEHAKLLLATASELSPDEPYIKQQLALATYKACVPTAITALDVAHQILSSLNPERTTDTETLGLLGAIFKRRYDITDDVRDLEHAIDYYGRGFLLAKDYYNGINLSLLLLKQALTRQTTFDAVTDIILARRVRARTESYCLNLIKNKFDERPDQVWILLTLAEIKFANGENEQVEELLLKVGQLQTGKFERESFDEQIAQLVIALKATDELMSQWPF